jgi:hypothetical protein
MATTVTVNDVLDGHVVLDMECLDRIYLNGYVPNLQMGGQVVSFLTQHLGNPIPSPAILEKIGTAFRRAVASFVEDNRIPVVRFGKTDRKIDVMRPYLARQSRHRTRWCGRDRDGPGVRAGIPATKHTGQTSAVWFSYAVSQRRVSCYYFYLWDKRFRAGIYQGLRLLPVSDEDLGQRPQVGQTTGAQGRHRVHRAIQRVRHRH